MENDPYISLDSLEDCDPDGYSEHKDNVIDVNPSFGNKEMGMAATFPKMNIMSCRSLPSYYSSNDFIHSRTQYSKSKLCAPNRSVKCKIGLENVNRAKKSTYLEMFRKKMSFNGYLVPKKEDSVSCLHDSRGWCCIKESTMAHPSNQDNYSSSAEASEDHCSLDSSGSSLQSFGMGEACNSLGMLSHQDTNGEESILSQSSASVQKEHGKKENKGSTKIDESCTDLLESNHKTPSGMAKLKSVSAREGHFIERNKDLTLITNEFSLISCSEKRHDFTNQNKLSKFLMRNAYGNSVSDFNCKIKASSQKLQTPKNIVSPGLKEGTKEITQLYNEEKSSQNGREPLKFKPLKPKPVTEEKKVNMPPEKNIKEGEDPQLKMQNLNKSSATAKRNKNKKSDNNLTFNLDFLMERHFRESQLLKKINEDVSKNAAI